MKKLSIIIPILNEEENIPIVYKRLIKVLKDLKPIYNYEILFNDNNSTDSSFSLIKEIAKKDKNVKAIKFSKNFGYQPSILAGYKKVNGDIAMQIDCDMQDPPELIPSFIKKYEEGYDVIYGVRISRKENFFINNFRKGFYWLINKLSESDIPRNAGDFRLVSRRVINEISKINDPQPYLRGAIASMGFNQIGIEYSRDARTKGKSKFNLMKLINLGLDGILNHSTIPLRVSTFLGVITSIISLSMACFYIFGKFYFGNSWNAGFATTTVLLLLSLSVNAILLGIIGEYLGRIYKKIKSPFDTIIVEKINMDK